MQRDELLPPPRWGDHGAVNRHLTAGGTVEGIPWGNPYLPYIKQLMERNIVREIIREASTIRSMMITYGITIIGLLIIDIILNFK